MRFRQKPASKAGPFPLLDGRPKRRRKEMLLVAPNPMTGCRETALWAWVFRCQRTHLPPSPCSPWHREMTVSKRLAHPPTTTTQRKKKERMGRERMEREGKKEREEGRRGERERREERKRQREKER